MYKIHGILTQKRLVVILACLTGVFYDVMRVKVVECLSVSINNIFTGNININVFGGYNVSMWWRVQSPQSKYLSKRDLLWVKSSLCAVVVILLSVNVGDGGLSLWLVGCVLLFSQGSMAGCVSSAQTCCSTDLVMSLSITQHSQEGLRERERANGGRRFAGVVQTHAVCWWWWPPPLPLHSLSIMNLSLNLNSDLNLDNKQSHLCM